MKTSFYRLSYLAWLVVPALGWLIVQTYGLPHILWSYQWRGSPNAPFEERWKTRCQYIGPYGEFSVVARNGSCGWWVRLFSKQEGQ